MILHYLTISRLGRICISALTWKFSVWRRLHRLQTCGSPAIVKSRTERPFIRIMQSLTEGGGGMRFSTLNITYRILLKSISRLGLICKSALTSKFAVWCRCRRLQTRGSPANMITCTERPFVWITQWLTEWGKGMRLWLFHIKHYTILLKPISRLVWICISVLTWKFAVWCRTRRLQTRASPANVKSHTERPLIRITQWLTEWGGGMRLWLFSRINLVRKREVQKQRKRQRLVLHKNSLNWLTTLVIWSRVVSIESVTNKLGK